MRERGEIERLLKRAYHGEPPVDRLMSGLATVASALNANDQCLARIAAVHLEIPDLPSAATRDAMAAEDSLIKYARDEGTGGANWNPALHPRTGTPPNPGWFAPTDGTNRESSRGELSGSESRMRFAEHQNVSHSADAVPPPHSDWVKLPPGEYVDELADFVEWLANAKPEDEKAIRAEIKRYYYDVGDTTGGDALNRALSDVLQPGTTTADRQSVAAFVAHYAHSDPAKIGFDRELLSGVALFSLRGCSADRCRNRRRSRPKSSSRRRRSSYRRINARLFGSSGQRRAEKSSTESFAAANSMSYLEPSTISSMVTSSATSPST